MGAQKAFLLVVFPKGEAVLCCPYLSGGGHLGQRVPLALTCRTFRVASLRHAGGRACPPSFALWSHRPRPFRSPCFLYVVHNQVALALEGSRKQSCSKNSRHLFPERIYSIPLACARKREAWAPPPWGTSRVRCVSFVAVKRE
uniref:Putative secreted protein n=1 Tax=Ixodes scapularis TaxID=6945 RepID=A0A4D5S0N0_IXOSC